MSAPHSPLSLHSLSLPPTSAPPIARRSRASPIQRLTYAPIVMEEERHLHRADYTAALASPRDESWGSRPEDWEGVRGGRRWEKECVSKEEG